MTDILHERNQKFAKAIQSEYEAERIKTQSRYKHLVQERMGVADMKDAGDKAVQGETEVKTTGDLLKAGDQLLADDTSVADERLKALRSEAREADFEQYCRDLYRVTKGQFSVEAFEARRKITHPDARKKPTKDGEEKPKEVEPPHCVYPTWAALPPHIQDILDNPGFGEVRKYPGMYQFRRAIGKPTPHRTIDKPPTERAELRKQRAENPRLDVNEMTFEELILDQYRRYKVDDLARTKTFNDWMGFCTDRLPSYRRRNPYIYAFDDMDLLYPDKKFNWRYQHYMDNNEYSPAYWYHSYNTYRGVVPGHIKPYHSEDKSKPNPLNLEYVTRRRHVDFPRYAPKYGKYVFLDESLANHTSVKAKNWAKAVTKFYETENPLVNEMAATHENLKYETKRSFEEVTGRPAMLRRDALFQKKSERDALRAYLRCHNVRLEKDKFLAFLDSGCKMDPEMRRNLRAESTGSGVDDVLEESDDLGFKVDLLAEKWQSK